MKKSLPVFLFFLTFIIGSCDDNIIAHINSFELSQKVWLDFKNSSDNSYTYKTTGASWTGNSWSTVITVDAGQVIGRNFSYDRFYDIAKPTSGWDEESRNSILLEMDLTAAEFEDSFGNNIEDFLEWQEDGESLNSHNASGASEVMTLDDVYTKSKTDWLVSRKNTQTFFETENNGMISLSGFVPDNCQDDCFTGIRIVEIRAL
jgi:hypothetical protein